MNEIVATGRRKEARATVRLINGTGKITVNKKDIKEYFHSDYVIYEVMKPLELTNLVGKLDIRVFAKGGGVSGQKDAIIHGISRALVKMEPNFRKVLKDAGFLKRDPRMVERKKYGRPKARKRFQFSKR